ncbi:MAG: hypothetical protein HY038_05640 [Nitrospirae bacterium]|nr:hypothetical protein [Nitrospirota bacterium]
MPTLTAEHLIELLTRYVTDTGTSVDLLLVSALALHAYGLPDRATRDVGAELEGPLTPLMDYLTTQKIPADLTQNFSGWSVVAMPPGYRDRAMDLVNQPPLRVRALSPVDFVIAKLRRGTELDLDDALLVARRHGLSPDAIRASAHAALAASPQDTALFLFQKTVDLFCKSLLSPNG